MPTDLSTIDVNKPDTASQDVPTCINYERETRQAIVNTNALEHHPTGEHKMPYGDNTARPAAGHAGRLYLNSEIKDFERDSGAGWIPLGFYSKRIRVVVYMGDGNINKSLAGLGFAPRAVLIIPVSGFGNMVIRTVNFTGANSHQVAIPATITDGIVSLDADGFTVGLSVNVNGQNYSAICLTDL